MNWEQLLSLKRFGDTHKRLRTEQDENRLGFEVDYDRIIFSKAFRSLQDKTQVVPLSQEDFVHTRLTHSLEVSVVGRSLGRLAGKHIIDKHPYLKEMYGYQSQDFGSIVAAAALAHDIGNPPFGHSGEKAIGMFFSNGIGKQYKAYLNDAEYEDLVRFEGNANGFNVLTNGDLGNEGGLRLSYATLGAFMKYPKASLPHKPDRHIASKKYGFFQKDKAIFKDIAEELGLEKIDSENALRYTRHPLTFLVEAADDICYTIIDFEDGINLGLIHEEYALEYLINLVKDAINKEKYKTLKSKSSRIAYLRALAINTLINDAVRIFMENEEAILNGSFSVGIMDKSKFAPQIEDIIRISVDKVYRSNAVVEKEISGYQIISKILEVYCEAVINYFNDTKTAFDNLILSTLPAHVYKNKPDIYSLLISISGYVASFSDVKIRSIHRKITQNG